MGNERERSWLGGSDVMRRAFVLYVIPIPLRLIELSYVGGYFTAVSIRTYYSVKRSKFRSRHFPGQRLRSRLV